MSIITRGFRKIGFCLSTVAAKVRWGGNLAVDGLFSKRHDTQIIIIDGGKIDLKKNVTFQRNVSLTSVGGYCTLGKMLHLTATVSSYAVKLLPSKVMFYSDPM